MHFLKALPTPPPLSSFVTLQYRSVDQEGKGICPCKTELRFYFVFVFFFFYCYNFVLRIRSKNGSNVKKQYCSRFVEMVPYLVDSNVAYASSFFFYISRYLWALSVTSHPVEEIVADILKHSRADVPSEKLHETLILTLAALTGRFCETKGNSDRKVRVLCVLLISYERYLISYEPFYVLNQY